MSSVRFYSTSEIGIESNIESNKPSSLLSHMGHLIIILLPFKQEAHQKHDLHIRKYFDFALSLYSESGGLLLQLLFSHRISML